MFSPAFWATARMRSAGPTRIGTMMPASAASTAPRSEDSSQGCTTAVGIAGFSRVRAIRRSYLSWRRAGEPVWMFTLAGDPASVLFIPWSPLSRAAVPVQDHADVAGHAVGVVQDLCPQLVAERTQILVPGVVGFLGEAGQCFGPVR